MTQPVPELTLTFTLRQGLAEHSKREKDGGELRVQMFMPCSFWSFLSGKWSFILEIILGPLGRSFVFFYFLFLRGETEKGKVLSGVKNSGTVTL